MVGPALKKVKRKIHVVDVDDPLYAGPGERVGSIEYEDFIAAGDPAFKWRLPEDEYAPIALNYTSGTTGRPKGVVYHHRGTFLEAMGHVAAWAMPMHPVYLWTLPLFHCNGWAFAWTTVAMCGTPTVLTMLTSAPPGQRRSFPHAVHIQTGGSPPPAKVIQAMESLGFKVMHIYGMTELQGPSTLCLPQDHWAALPLGERANLMARQGVRYQVVEGHIVGDPRTCRPVPQDGETIGEVLIQGNTVMLGYLKDEKATREAFHGGWMHTGDLAVWHPGGYVEIKDRKKDIIISSVEVEIALYKHPATQLAAVVARPDDKWGGTPCAFVQRKPGATATEADYIAWCREHLARFKVPKTVVFCDIPTTATGKIQKYVLRETAKAL